MWKSFDRGILLLSFSEISLRINVTKSGVKKNLNYHFDQKTITSKLFTFKTEAVSTLAVKMPDLLKISPTAPENETFLRISHLGI